MRLGPCGAVLDVRRLIRLALSLGMLTPVPGYPEPGLFPPAFAFRTCGFFFKFFQGRVFPGWIGTGLKRLIAPPSGTVVTLHVGGGFFGVSETPKQFPSGLVILLGPGEGQRSRARLCPLPVLSWYLACCIPHGYWAVACQHRS